VAVVGARDRGRRLGARGLGCILALPLVAAWLPAQADSATGSVFVRTDSNETVVVSPRAELSKRLGNTEINAAYTADVWTSASIDIVAAATRTVTEQRDEIDVGVTEEDVVEDVALTGSYRYSVENDYESHGASGGITWDLAMNNVTLALTGGFFADTVGRSGAPQFSESLTTVVGRLAYTQVLDMDTLAQVTYELGSLKGYQASPYRFVGIGGDGFGCEAASSCLPERLPNERLRNAVAGRVRHALTDELSADVNYRFYLDDWNLRSHTVATQLSWMPFEHLLVSFRYRFYIQSSADFYRRIYVNAPAPNTYVTRDRELSPLNDHRLALEVSQRIPLWSGDSALALSANLGGNLFTYSDFVGLDQVRAIDVTFAIGVEQ